MSASLKKNRRWTKLLLQVSSFVVLLFLAQLQRLLRKQLLKLSNIVNGAGYFPKRFVSWSFSAPHSLPHGQIIQGQTAPTAFFTHLISLHIKPQFLGTICILINMVRKIDLSIFHPYCDRHSDSCHSFSIVAGLQGPTCSGVSAVRWLRTFSSIPEMIELDQVVILVLTLWGNTISISILAVLVFMFSCFIGCLLFPSHPCLNLCSWWNYVSTGNEWD